MPQQKNYTIHHRNITVFQTENEAPCVWLNTFAQGAESVWNLCQELNAPPFTLAAIQINDWNSALSPWTAPAIFKGEVDFGGQGSAYLKELTGCIIPEVTELLSLKSLYHAIAGYSMAGLFAIWSLYQTGLFQRAASGLSGIRAFRNMLRHMIRSDDRMLCIFHLATGNTELGIR